MAGLTIKVTDLKEVKAIVDQLKSKNTRLKLQLEKVLEAIGVEDVDVPCPSNVGLNDTYGCGLAIECPQCWRDALEAVVVKSDDVIEIHPDGPLSSTDVAGMHQDGTLCNQCGEYIGEAVGSPRLCAGCED